MATNPVTLDLSKSEPLSAPVKLDLSKSQPLTSSPSPAPKQEKGVLGKLWDWANEGIVSKDTFVRAMSGMTGDQLNEALKSYPSESPVHAAIREFTRGSIQDTGQTASSFTSPLAVGTMAVGAAGKIPGAAGKVAKAVTGLASAGFAGQGASQVVKNAPAALEGNSEAAQAALQGGAMVAGGTAGLGETAKLLPNKVGSIVASMKSPLGNTVTTRRGPSNAEAFTPIELKQYADANGIPLNAAQATEHNLPRNLQNAGERATIGGTAVKQQTQDAQAAVAQHTEQLMQRMSPNTPDLASAGERIQQQTQAALDRETSTANNNFARVDAVAKGTSIDTRPIAAETKNLLGGHGFVEAVAPQMGPKRALAITRSLQDLPENISFTQAQQLRSALLDESRHPDTALSSEAQGVIKRLTGIVDHQMEVAARSGSPGLWQEFRDANSHYKGLQEDFNNQRSPLAQVLAEPDPSKVPQKLTQKGQIGGSPYNAQLLDKYGIDKGPVKFAIMQDMATRDFRLFNAKNIAGYTHDFLQSVFTPQELTDVYKTGAISRSVGLNTNTSGTAVVKGAMEDVQKPIRSLAPKALAAKLTNSQSFNNWLLNNPQPPRTAPPRTWQAWLSARYKARAAAGLVAGAASAENTSGQQ